MSISEEQRTETAVTMVEGFNAVQFDRVHSWLTETYWSPGISKDRVMRAAEHSSLIVSAFLGDQQVGYLRVVSDKTHFGYFCDVIVSPDHRGRGIGRTMVQYALGHPEYAGMRRWMLATKDAHGVYEGVGFSLLDNPENWMILRPEPVG
ncbi:MAG: GNAT family N-acetyltransferase [Chthonomonadales bacterium]